MSADENAELVRRYFGECVNQVNGPNREGALALVDELLTDDFAMAYNNQPDGEAGRGRARHIEFLVEHARWFLGDRWTVEALVADDTVVACQWRIVATHAEAGNPIDVRAADFFTVRDSRLAALRRFLDGKDLAEQIRGRRRER